MEARREIKTLWVRPGMSMNDRKKFKLHARETYRKKMCSWQARYEAGDTGRITFSFVPDIRERMEMEYFTQFLASHGAFADYLNRFKRVDCDKCRYCGLADGVLDIFGLTREMVDTKFGADCLRIKVSDLEERGFRARPYEACGGDS